MNFGLAAILLTFAIIGFAGTGASLAVSRFRWMNEGETDVGMFGVAAMLMLFGSLCTAVAVGWLGVLAVGGLVVWTSYIVMAHNIGLFSLEIGTPRDEEVAPMQHRY